MACYDDNSIYIAQERAPSVQYVRAPSSLGQTIHSTAKSIAIVPTAEAQLIDDPQPLEGYSLEEPKLASIVLPPPNFNCYQEPPTPQGEIRYVKHEEPTITKTIVQNFNSMKTVVKENNIHHQHNKTVVTNVNRNHWHTQRIVVKDNHFHHHLTNNVIKVADIHHQKIEQVRGESKTINDYKQTQRVEAPNCIVDSNNALLVERPAEDLRNGSEIINLVEPSVIIEDNGDNQAVQTLANQSQWWNQ